MAHGVSSTRSLTCRLLRLLLLFLSGLLLLPVPLRAQSGGVGFWELSARQEAFMLNLKPSTDAERYSTLRADFIRFGCEHHLAEQPLPSDDAAPQHNLICTLPGKYPMPVVILASYPARSGDARASSGWPAAVLLPILFQALKAQPRTFTYLFAELCGEEGERVFLEQLHLRQPRIPPVSFIALDALGTGVPHFAAAGPRSQRQVRQILENEGWHIAKLQGFGDTLDYQKEDKQLRQAIFPNRLTEPLRPAPHVLVFGRPKASPTPQAFHKNFEFLAFYLCALDVKLDPLADTGD